MSAVLALIVTAGFWLIPPLRRSFIVGMFYFPAILVTVLLSHSHSPSAAASNVTIIVYTLLYLVVFLVTYALLLEIYLVRRVSVGLEDTKQRLMDGEGDPQTAIETLGGAIKEVEKRRRKHFLLKSNNLIDLNAPPEVVAAHVISAQKKTAPARRMLKNLESRLREGGKEKAKERMTLLEKVATTHLNIKKRDGAADSDSA